MCAKTQTAPPRPSAPHHPIPPLPQVGQKPQINSSGGANAHAKTNPTSSGRGQLLQDKSKTSRTNRHKNVDFQQHLPPAAQHPSQECYGRARTAGGKTRRSLSVSTPTPRVPTSNSRREGLAMQPKRAGGRGNGRVEKGSRGRRMSDSYPQMAGSMHSTDLRLGTAPRMRAHEGPGPTGKPREERARRVRERVREQSSRQGAGEERA